MAIIGIYTVGYSDFAVKPILSAAKIKASVGKGYEPKQMSNIPASMKWFKNIADIKSFTNLKY